MDKKIILSLCGNVLLAFSIIFLPPAIYAEFALRLSRLAIIFLLIGLAVLACGIFFVIKGRGHKRKLHVAESATTAILIYPILAIFGVIPILLSGYLSPIDSMLETISNLTSTGLSLLPNDADYIFRLWQSLLMWFGSMIFLNLLVTLLPEVSGDFGLSLSLHGGQIFSSMFGQMFAMSKKISKVYISLTLLSIILFKLSGLNFLDSLVMALRCISTGGGDFYPAQRNIYVDYSAAFTMLMACGNFLFYHRLIYTIPPPERTSQENIFIRTANYFKRLKQNIFDNVKLFFYNSEIKVIGLIIFLCVGFIFVSIYQKNSFEYGNLFFRQTFFHVISFLSTTGITFTDFNEAHDFDRFLIFLTAIFGGSMGSVTGGIKILRAIVLAKIFSAEMQKVMHPHIMPNIRVNKIAVPNKIAGNILAFFFLAALTLFVCSGLLSFTGSTFSDGVAMSAVCLTTVGNLPGICGADNFLNLTIAGKIFCMLILIVGRLEIFAFLIVLANIKFHRKIKSKW